MVYTCCQYVNFVWISWCMLSMLSVCLVYVVCVCVQYTCICGVCWLCVVYVEYALCMFSIDTSMS